MEELWLSELLAVYLENRKMEELWLSELLAVYLENHSSSHLLFSSATFNIPKLLLPF